jgi:hypothetical protein
VAGRAARTASAVSPSTPTRFSIHRRIHQAGQDAVDADAMSGVGDRHASAEAGHGRLVLDAVMAILTILPGAGVPDARHQ